jgi:hypothetical protein
MFLIDRARAFGGKRGNGHDSRESFVPEPERAENSVTRRYVPVILCVNIREIREKSFFCQRANFVNKNFEVSM